MMVRSFAALSLLVVMAFCPMALADDEQQRQMTVNGNGESAAIPDIAVMSIGVETVAKTPSEALSENASRMNAVIARLKDAGIADKDLQTSQLSIWPVYADRSRSSYQSETEGFRANNQLNVTLRDIERIGEILDQAVTDGANTLSGPTFMVAEPEPFYQKARDVAVADAMAKAERYAAAAGVALGKVLRIDEGGSRGPAFTRQMRAETQAAATPIAAGETTFSASVTMVFAID